MNAAGLKELREKHGWSQSALAETLNVALDRKYRSAQVSSWEREDRPIPENVSAFLNALAIDMNLGGTGEPRFEAPEPPDPTEDSPPFDSFEPQIPAGTSGIYARACTELWEMVAMGIGMAGAVTGSDKLQADGRIISADSRALGIAYGKLAETNETFRKMLAGATSGGAWLEVALVTGTTVSKCWANHSTQTGGALVHLPTPTDEQATAS